MSVLRRTPPQRQPVDPRPELLQRDGELLLAGSRCEACGHPMVVQPPRCPACGAAAMAPASFGPEGVVFSSTVLRIPVPGREPPFAVAYVDVDDGPRILAHCDNPERLLDPGSRVRLAGWNSHGDPVVAAVAPAGEGLA